MRYFLLNLQLCKVSCEAIRKKSAQKGGSLKNRLSYHQNINRKNMKTIKLFALALIALVAFSCSDSNPIENPNTPEGSVALRTALNEFRLAGGNQSPASFCFEFVYPLTFSFNNGTEVTVTDADALASLLQQETPTMYLNGIEYPFQVMHSGALVTISNNDAFTALLDGCGFNTFNDDLTASYCFDIVFPISVYDNNQQQVTINSYQEFLAYMSGPAGVELQVIFPISVVMNNQTVVVDNIYEFYQVVNSCDTGCVCTQDYNPVCVQTATGVIEFGNMCYALCAGFTQNDIVPCGGTPGCNITNLQVTPGTCISNTEYPVTINFSYTGSGFTHFEVWASNSTLLGTYPLSQLPVTVNFPFNGTGTHYLVVKIQGDPTCTANQQWIAPDCTCVCPTVFDPVCVQTATGLVQYSNACEAECDGFGPADFVDCPTYNFGQSLMDGCFDVHYPVQVQHQGALVTVEADGMLLQYWNPSQNPMPAFVYPISVAFGNSTFLINSQQEFENLILDMCN